ncbi:MAG: hypothetical protein WBV06_08245, partial [Acidimicrobiia bacterium]
MFRRLAVLIGTVLTALMAVGMASALVNSNAGLPVGSSSEPVAATSAEVATADAIIYEVADAGTVSVTSNGLALEIASIEPAEGWSGEIEGPSGREVEAQFSDGDRQIHFKAEIDGGQIEAKVEANDDTAKVGDDSVGDDSVGDDRSGSDDTSADDHKSGDHKSGSDDQSVSDDSVGDDSVNDNRSGSDDTSADDDKSGSDDGSSSDDRSGHHDDNGVTTTMAPTTTVPPTSSTTMPPATSTVTYDAGDGGTVTITFDGTTLTLVGTGPSAGWSPEVEAASGREIDVDFRNGDRRIRFSAELEDGQVRIK